MPTLFLMGLNGYCSFFKGVKNLLLLDPATTDQSMFPSGETHQSFDLRNENFELPATSTYYNCRLHKLPDFSGK